MVIIKAEQIDYWYTDRITIILTIYIYIRAVCCAQHGIRRRGSDRCTMDRISLRLTYLKITWVRRSRFFRWTSPGCSASPDMKIPVTMETARVIASVLFYPISIYSPPSPPRPRRFGLVVIAIGEISGKMPEIR